MPVDLLFIIATLAFAWGLSLATYRLFAVYNGWPMGEWQAHRPGLPIAIGLFSVVFAMLFAFARGGTTVLIVPLFGVLCALAWTAVTRIGAQSALLLAPLAVTALLLMWIAAAATASVSAPARAAFPGNATLPLSPYDRALQEPAPKVLPPLGENARVIPTDRQPGLVPSPQLPSPQR